MKLCSQLKAYGMDIDYEKIRSEVDSFVITRGQIADEMIRKGYIETKAEAFSKYIGKGAPCYVPKNKIAVSDAVKMILQVGGIPVLAHPVKYALTDDEYIRLFTYLKSLGVRGIEGIYSTNTPEEEKKFCHMAADLGFIVTGGSDFHGKNKPDIDMGTGRGNLKIPAAILHNLGLE